MGIITSNVVGNYAKLSNSDEMRITAKNYRSGHGNFDCWR